MKSWKICCSCLTLFVLLSVTTFAVTPVRRLEAYYQVRAAKYFDGDREEVLPDGTRVDVSTDDKVVEVEFAHKWYEAIGQSSHYAVMTGKSPYIYIVSNTEKDDKYVERCKRVCSQLQVETQEGKWEKITVVVDKDNL